MHEIHLSDIEPLIRHLPMILDKLLELMVTTYRVGGETLILDATVFVTLCQISQKFSVSRRVSLGKIHQTSKYSLYQGWPVANYCNRHLSQSAVVNSKKMVKTNRSKWSKMSPKGTQIVNGTKFSLIFGIFLILFAIKLHFF